LVDDRLDDCGGDGNNGKVYISSVVGKSLLFVVWIEGVALVEQ
jgi:hypothetical protein